MDKYGRKSELQGDIWRKSPVWNTKICANLKALNFFYKLLPKTKSIAQCKGELQRLTG